MIRAIFVLVNIALAAVLSFEGDSNLILVVPPLLLNAIFLIWPGEIFSLWFKRRSLEEQKKIDELSKR